MYLHLGNDISLRESEIISIHDFEIFRSGENKSYFDRMRKQKAVIYSNCLLKNARSLIITEDKIYLSAISPMTLKSRTAVFG